jgi:predicted ATP-grasp superfamily ATP-dependent carboligase
MEKTGQFLLLAGVDVVRLAYSAKKAGYRVFSFDYFGDVDLRTLSDEWFSFNNEQMDDSSSGVASPFDSSEFQSKLGNLCGDEHISGVLLGSGLDDDNSTLTELDNRFGIIGNKPSIIEKVRNKYTFYRELEKLGINHPTTRVVEDIEDCRRFIEEIGFPVVIKPTHGFGGYRIRRVDNWENLQHTLNFLKNNNKKVILQRFIQGANCSVSFISTERGGTLLSINEQLLGLSEVFQTEPFGYCGNIVPMITGEKVTEEIRKLTNLVSNHFKLRGSNGIDLVLTPDNVPYLIEVNPRFQGTLECVEKHVNINLVETHIEACLKAVEPRPKTVQDKSFTRLILYSPKRTAAPDLSSFNGIRDIPIPGIIIEKGGPLCTVFSEGESRKESYEKALQKAKKIYDVLN